MSIPYLLIGKREKILGFKDPALNFLFIEFLFIILSLQHLNICKKILERVLIGN